jgi:hypothetical protein
MIDGSYEYIMRLPVSAFTAEKIAKHEKIWRISLQRLADWKRQLGVKCGLQI